LDPLPNSTFYLTRTGIRQPQTISPADLPIAEALDLRVVGGETHFTRFDLKPFFENPLPILQPDPMRGGLTDLRKIAAVADTWGMTIARILNVQLLASIPNGLWIENMGLSDDLWILCRW
jgi:L-alanine-DL-glutamate epimerase-like enolase superfamily enzyme